MRRDQPSAADTFHARVRRRGQHGDADPLTSEGLRAGRSPRSAPWRQVSLCLFWVDPASSIRSARMAAFGANEPSRRDRLSACCCPEAALLRPQAKRLRRWGSCHSLPLRWSAEVCQEKTPSYRILCGRIAIGARLASFRGLLLRTNVGAVSPTATTGLMGGVRPLNTAFGFG